METYTTTNSCYLKSDGNGNFSWTDGIASIPVSDIVYTTNTGSAPELTITTTSTPFYSTYTYIDELTQLKNEINELKNQINKLTKTAKEGSNAMANFSNLNNIFPNADFGPVNSDTARLSPHGIAISANGKWQAYDKESCNIIDVTPMNFNCANMIYKMPVGIDQIKIGDIILHARKPMFVLNVINEEGKVRLTAVDIINAEEKTICPIKSVFGFDFYTKLVCLVDMAGGFQADAKNPFGNFMPWLLMSDQKDNDMLPLLLMSGQKFDMNNPLMLMALCGNDHSNLLSLMLMMNAPKAE